jgi:Bacterial-like globin
MARSMSPPVRRPRAGAGSKASLFERIGGEKVERLVAAFYARVDSDPVIRPLYFPLWLFFLDSPATGK